MRRRRRRGRRQHSTAPGAPAGRARKLTKLADMGGDRIFQTGGVEYDFTAAAFTNGVTRSFGNRVRVAYTQASDSYTLTASDNSTATFAPADVVQPAPGTPPGVLVWRKTSGTTVEQFALATPIINNVPLSYTAIGTWLTAQAGTPNGHVRIGVGGAPTIASDMPKTGTASYTTLVGGAAKDGTNNYMLTGNSSGTFSANFATGAITTALILAGTQAPSGTTVTAFGTFNGTGTIASGTSGYTGTFGCTAMNGSAATGGFAGGFFGPQALETGYGYTLGAGTLTAVGTLSGVKQ